MVREECGPGGGWGSRALIPVLEVGRDSIVDQPIIRQSVLAMDREGFEGVEVPVFLEDRPDDLTDLPCRTECFQAGRVGAYLTPEDETLAAMEHTA